MNDAATKVEPLAAKGGSPPTAAGPGQVREAQLRWDEQKMATSFANVVNIQSTREQVDLFFGAAMRCCSLGSNSCASCNVMKTKGQHDTNTARQAGIIN